MIETVTYLKKPSQLKDLGPNCTLVFVLVYGTIENFPCKIWEENWKQKKISQEKTQLKKRSQK